MASRRVFISVFVPAVMRAGRNKLQDVNCVRLCAFDLDMFIVLESIVSPIFNTNDFNF